jgi:hypothetical protein
MTVKQNQSTFDVATQINGDPRSVLDLCLENDLEIASTFNAGNEIKTPQSDYKNEDVLSYYRAREIELATGLEIAPFEPIGIGTMILKTNFDVS